MKKWSIATAFSMHSELAETLSMQPIMELAGDRRILIENHSGVTEYSTTQIGIQVAYGILLVCGNNLELTQMTRNHLVIIGSVEKIILLRKEAK